MQMTAAVINAGLGDISLGLKMAGFKVIAAYETDGKAVAVHKANIDTLVYPIPAEGIDVECFPKVDLLAARIYQAGFSPAMRTQDIYSDPAVYSLRKILSNCKPRFFLLQLNVSFIKGEWFHKCLKEIVEERYQVSYRVVDVAQATGMPVVEKKVYVVGNLLDIGEPFHFPKYSFPSKTSLEDCLQTNQQIDPWYFYVRQDDIPPNDNTKRVYCWKNHGYEGTDFVRWNYIKIPLIRTADQFRRITHREVANLKGFPAEYILPDETNRQWLYQKLMYACNVEIVKQIAERIDYSLTGNPWRSRQVENAMRFEDLFGRYLANLADKGIVELEPHMANRIVDFVLHKGSENLYFEVKYYNSSFALASKVMRACERIASLAVNGVPILVIASEVPVNIKRQCLEKFHVSVWDVGNLLWLFDEFADIKNEFIALLDYAVGHIEPTPPETNVFQQMSENKKDSPSWEVKLRQITPGPEQSQEYELLCIEILKYVLGEYLSLWSSQRQANNGLYRFDLCCKIKNGVEQDFFDTVKHYFNTKYIVFEFKNYVKKISQKEIYTTEKYLYEKALRKVAIIISRLGADDHAKQAARGSLRETGKLIICLSDKDLLEMINIKVRGENEPAEYLSSILDDILVCLEK